MSYALLGFDTDHIKEYVFATDALKEIRGASARLDDLNRRVMPNIVKEGAPGARIIYANGGAGLFVLDAAYVEDAESAIKHAYYERTSGATSVTSASVALPPDFDMETSNAQDLMRLLQVRMRAAKDCPPSTLAITTLPHLRFCDSCGQSPAETSIWEYGRTQSVCRACELRRQDPGELPGSLLSASEFRGNRPEDLDTLGELSEPKGYLGLIYADGNGIGSLLEECRTLPEICRFAEEVDGAIVQATRHSIAHHLQPVDGRLPFDVLLMGGDDLVMVTRAQSAIDVALSLAEEFGDYTEQAYAHRFSLSVAVVLAHARFPFRTMLDLAESTLKFAKTEAAKRQLDDRSLINFLVITSSNHLDFKQFYNEILRVDEGPVKVCRTLRPYTPKDLLCLVKTARVMQGAPRNKLHALSECVFFNRQKAVLEGLTILSRWRNGAESGLKAEQVRALKDFVQQAGTGKWVFPWNVENNEWKTPLLDLVELFEFVKEEDNAGMS